MSRPSSPPPISRRERKKQRTRQQIYGAAMKLFGEGGFDGVSVEAICEEADVARATFFAHFPTKASLLLEFTRVIDERYEGAQGEPPATASEALRLLWEQTARSWSLQGEVMVAMLREFIQLPDTVVLPADDPTPLHSRVARIIERGQASGEFRRGIEPVVLAHVALLTAATVMLGASTRGSPESPQKFLDQFMELILHGLVADDGER